MFGNDFEVCMDVAENLSGVHHIWVAGGNFSYIALNKGGVIFTSNPEKFQVLGQPSVKWNENHFINMNETGKRLAMEILEQVGEYKREGEVIISAEELLAGVDAFESKKREWSKQFWVDDIEKLEIEKWANFLETQENPIFQDFAVFLNCHLNEDEDAESDQIQPHFRELLKSEIDAANKLGDFLADHSNDLLREGAEWIPQWLEAH